MTTEERLDDLEALVAQALEIGAHHSPEHGDLGRDPFIHANVQGHSHITPLAMHAPGAATTWTNMPAVLTAFLGVTTQNTKFDMSPFTQARLVAQIQVAGSGSAKLRIQHSAIAISWAYLDGTSAPSLDISGTGLKVSDWATLEADAGNDHLLRLVGIDGDGAADPQFGLIVVQFR